MRSIRRFLEKEGFLGILPPIVEAFTDPGIRGAKFFEVDYYGMPYKLMSAFTLHKPILATHLGKIFAFCPCARKEPEESRFTGRHLAQFWQVEVEIDEGSYEDAMRVLERLIQFVVREVKEKCEEELRLLGRDLKIPEVPFKRLTHKEAVDIAKKLGIEAYYDKELPWEAEKAISAKFSKPFFVVKYPRGSRGFYDKDSGEFLLDFDLLLPEGFGEVSSGSEREYEYEKIREKISQMCGLDEFDLYLRIVRKGVKPTAGFGLGLERLTRFVCGLDKIWDATPFPKIPGVHYRMEEEKI
jgi:asparaginyl-tRNA synthetase